MHRIRQRTCVVAPCAKAERARIPDAAASGIRARSAFAHGATTHVRCRIRCMNDFRKIVVKAHPPLRQPIEDGETNTGHGARLDEPRGFDDTESERSMSSHGYIG